LRAVLSVLRNSAISVLKIVCGGGVGDARLY